VATLRDIRRRIASVNNTRKITKAMEMVAAAKLRRAQNRIEALRPYAADMIEMMVDLATYSGETSEYPLLQERDPESVVAVLVMTGDRGLAGAFNANVLRRAFEVERTLREDGRETRVLAVGKKGIGTLRFRRCTIERSWQGLSDRPEYNDAKQIADHLIGLYLRGEVEGEGCGLGLSIASRIASLSNARLELGDGLPRTDGGHGFAATVHFSGATAAV